jgi:hypothetical protein
MMSLVVSVQGGRSDLPTEEETRWAGRISVAGWPQEVRRLQVPRPRPEDEGRA